MSDYKESLGQHTKEKVINALRHYFQVTSDFGTINSTIKMPLIREAYSDNIRDYPIVFIKIVNCRPQSMGLFKGYVQDIWSDNQLINQKYLPGTENDVRPKKYTRHVIGERYGYLADITFQLQIWGDKTYVRNRVVDETMSAFMRFEKDYLIHEGIVVTAITEGEENDFPLNDTEHVYIANLNLTVNAELYFDYPVPYVTGIKYYSATTPVIDPDQPPYIVQDYYDEEEY